MTIGLPASAASTPAGPSLRDIHLPPPPSWWPPAPGWWCLAVLVLAALGWLAYRQVARRRRRRYRQALLTLVDEAAALGSPTEQVAALHALLRRAARRLDRRADTQRGADWRATLARVPVDAAVIDRLVDMDVAIYRPSPVADQDALLDATRQWLGAFADQVQRMRRASPTEQRA